jgi:GT2 family glycosyltransferase
MLVIVIVNYKNEEKTVSFVKEELVKITIPHLIVVVNNSATPESDKLLTTGIDGELIRDISKKPAGNTRFVVSHTDNLGYAKGNNLGVEFACLHFDISHILISNNDIRFISEEVVEKLIQKLDSLPDEVAMIGPSVIGLDGESQSPEPYISFWKRYIWMYWLTPFISANKKERIFRFNYSRDAEEGLHYKIMGSFFLIRERDFVKCGMFDPNTFLYGEEVILSERLEKIGKRAYYFPEVKILHEHGQTISSHLNVKKKILSQFESESYYYSKYRKVSTWSLFFGKLSVNGYIKLKKIQ